MSIAQIAYGKCNPADFPYKGLNVSVPIDLTATRSVTFNGTTTPLTISGTVSIVDGCTIALSNFTFSGVPQAQLFGALSGQADGIRLIEEIFESGKPYSGQYTLIQTAGNWVKLNFNQFRFYHNDTKTWIGQADLTNYKVDLGLPKPPAPYVPPPAAPAPSSSPAAQVPTSGALGSAVSILSSLIWMMAL